MRALLRDMLARVGFRIIEDAEDGASALAKLRHRSFTLIISDWYMEPMSGIELLREVKRLRSPGSNRFILITADRSWGNQTTARSDGADGYLVKPFTIETLTSKIEAVLSR
jgi:two-component system chemotaxis response regulator CheY